MAGVVVGGGGGGGGGANNDEEEEKVETMKRVEFASGDGNFR